MEFCNLETTSVGNFLLVWPESVVGSVVTLACPVTEGSSAFRQCSNEGEWLDPDLSECTLGMSHSYM